MKSSSLKNEITVSELSEDQFGDLEPAWTELLSKSEANPVFSSWCWNYTWWRVFGAAQRAELRILTATDKAGRLLGIAPMYLEASGRWPKSTRRLQLLGSRWRAVDDTRTEYMGFILDRARARDTADRLLNEILSMDDWDEVVICNHTTGSLLRERLGEWNETNGHLVRELERGDTFQLNLEGDFETYLASLSSKSRLRIYNRRKRLRTHGEVRLHFPKSAAEIEAALEALNRFHKERWNKTLLFGMRREFHHRVAVAMAERSMLDLSILLVGDRPISVLYDFVCPTGKFGFQLGFDQVFDKQLSPSQLHFGYAIESAYERSLPVYDFLRGAGKSQKSYKGGITTGRTETSTLQIVRNKRLIAMYRLRSLLGREPSSAGELRDGIDP